MLSIWEMGRIIPNIIWGLIHSLLYLPLFLFGKNRQYITDIVAENNLFPSIKEIFQIGITFLATMFAWVFFRSESISSGFEYLNIIVSKFSIPNGQRAGILFVFVLVIFDWSMKGNERNPLSYKNIYFRLEKKQFKTTN